MAAARAPAPGGGAITTTFPPPSASIIAPLRRRGPPPRRDRRRRAVRSAPAAPGERRRRRRRRHRGRACPAPRGAPPPRGEGRRGGLVERGRPRGARPPRPAPRRRSRPRRRQRASARGDRDDLAVEQSATEESTRVPWPIRRVSLPAAVYRGAPPWRCRPRPQPATLPLPGGRDGATVRLHPLLAGELLAPPGLLRAPARPAGAAADVPRLALRAGSGVPIPAFLVEHPGAGPILIDTGLHPERRRRPGAELRSDLEAAAHVPVLARAGAARAAARARDRTPRRAGSS